MMASVMMEAEKLHGWGRLIKEKRRPGRFFDG
jgi:hypothetical protein